MPLRVRRKLEVAFGALSVAAMMVPLRVRRAVAGISSGTDLLTSSEFTTTEESRDLARARDDS